MPRLKPDQVTTAIKASEGNTKLRKISDGANLSLLVRNGRGYWSYAWREGASFRTKLLGSAADMSPAQARRAREEAAVQRRNGVVPERRGIATRTAYPAAPATAQSDKTFGDVVEMFLAEFAPTWKGDKEAGAYRRTLLGNGLASVPVAEIDRTHVENTLKHYADTPATAEKVLIRIGKVLSYATAKDLRTGENPARIKGLWEFLARPVVPKAEHHKAMAYAELPKLIAELSTVSLTEARALAFTIATAARTDEVLGATWSEIDIKGALWNVPAERMKEGAAHSVPLAPAVIKLLGKPGKPGDYVFPGRRYGATKPMWHSAMRDVLKTLRPGYTVHGFRSSFADWVSEGGKYSRDLADMALAHAVGSKVSNAYQRSKLIEQRRPMMAAYSKFLRLR